jgi:hypothetical protein
LKVITVEGCRGETLQRRTIDVIQPVNALQCAPEILSSLPETLQPDTRRACLAKIVNARISK